MLRNILSVVVAFVVGGICVFAVEKIGHSVYPPPAGLDISNPQSIVEYVKNAPLGSLLFVLAAQSAGSLFGGLMTGLISVAKFPMAMTYGFVALIMALINIYIIPHPYWFIALSLLLPVPLSLLGSKIGQLFVAKPA